MLQSNMPTFSERWDKVKATDEEVKQLRQEVNESHKVARKSLRAGYIGIGIAVFAVFIGLLVSITA
jgi:hypothetical protein